MSQRPYTLPCSIFGGRSPRTGKPVGSRHRWNGSNHCDFCGRHRDDVKERPIRCTCAHDTSNGAAHADECPVEIAALGVEA